MCANDSLRKAAVPRAVLSRLGALCLGSEGERVGKDVCAGQGEEEAAQEVHATKRSCNTNADKRTSDMHVGLPEY